MNKCKGNNINKTSKADVGAEHIPPVIPKHVIRCKEGSRFWAFFSFTLLQHNSEAYERMNLTTEVYSQERYRCLHIVRLDRRILSNKSLGPIVWTKSCSVVGGCSSVACVMLFTARLPYDLRFLYCELLRLLLLFLLFC
jgi:hypothetical protein